VEGARKQIQEIGCDKGLIIAHHHLLMMSLYFDWGMDMEAWAEYFKFVVIVEGGLAAGCR
jgi:hypothetical protein